jgi:hypothetical protein
MMKRHIALFAIALAGCTNGVAEVDETTSNVATFPGAPAAAAGQLSADLTTDAIVTMDVQKDLASLNGLGTLTLTISKNAVSGADLAFVKHIKATIEAQDGTMPIELASDVEVPPHSTEALLPLQISDARLLEYLTEGKVAVHLYLTGNLPQQTMSLTHTMVAHLNIAVKASAVKF